MVKNYSRSSERSHGAAHSRRQIFKTPTRSSSHYERRNTPHFSRDEHPKINHYRLGRCLGEGAFGRCYEATSDRSGRRYALKVSLCSGHQGCQEAHKKREGRIRSRLANFPEAAEIALRGRARRL